MLVKNKKAPADGLRTLVGTEFGFWGQLEQIEFLCPTDSRPAIVDPQLVENVFGMGTKGVR